MLNDATHFKTNIPNQLLGQYTMQTITASEVHELEDISSSVAHNSLQSTIKTVDHLLGHGYSKKNPALLAAMLDHKKGVIQEMVRSELQNRRV